MSNKKAYIILSGILVLVIVAGAFGGGGELNGIQILLSRLTSTRAGYLDKLNITGNVADGNSYTATRAGKLDNLDAPISSRAASATALNTAIWTSTRAAKLDLVMSPPKIKTAASNVLSWDVTGLDLSHYPLPSPYVHSASRIGGDKINGVRLAEFSPTQVATYEDVLNLSGSGWVLGIYATNLSGSAATIGVKTTADSLVINETSYASLSNTSARIVIGEWGKSTDNFNLVILARYPMRYESALRVELKSSAVSTSIHGMVAYLPD